MYRWILYLFFSLNFSGSTYANPDSLILALKRAQTQKETVDALNNLSRFQIKYSFRKSIEYGREALDLSKRINYIEGVGIASLNLGWAYWMNSHYHKSLKHLNNAKRIFSERKDLSDLAQTNKLIGLGYHHKAQEDSAIKYLVIAGKQFEEVGDSTSWSLTLTNLSFAYAVIGEMEASNKLAVRAHAIKVTSETIRTQYYTWIFSGHSQQVYQNEKIIKSLIPDKLTQYEQGKKRNDPYMVAKASSEVGNLFMVMKEYDSAMWYHHISKSIYYSLKEYEKLATELVEIGECLLINNDFEAAEPFFERAHDLFFVEKNFGWVYTLDYLGKVALGRNQFKKALGYFARGVSISDSLGHLISVVRFKRRLSDTYRKEGNLEMALETANFSYLLSKEIGAPNHIMWGAEKLYLAYHLKKEYKRAFEFLKIHDNLAIQLERDLLNKENQKFQSVFELNEKTRVIDQLNLDNAGKQAKIDLQRSYLVSTILGALITLGFAVILNSRIREIRNLGEEISGQNLLLQTMNKDKEVLLKEVHHRVKNNLQMISSLMGMQRRRVEEPSTKLLFSYTQNRIKSIGLIHEHLYKTDTLSTIFLKPYLEELVEVILDSFHNKSKPVTKWEIPEYEVDIDTAIPIGLIVNELVTNAVKYAFADNENPVLKISMDRPNGCLRLKVKDNGPGGTITQAGFGWTIIRSMVESLSGSVELKSNDGLEVTILLEDPLLNTYSAF